MIELHDIKERLHSKIFEQIAINRRKHKFDVDFEFPNNDGIMFGFTGSWNWQDENYDKIEINISEAFIQLADFTADLNQRDIDKIESYFKN